MRIAITQRVVENSTYPDDRDALSHDWVHFLQAIVPGCVVIPVPNNIADCKTWMDEINPDALILSNGNDLDAAPIRDNCEHRLTRWALQREVPLLGVCRGLQFLNRYFDGDLTLELSQNGGQNHVACQHVVAVSHAAFDGFAGNTSATVMVNSFHDHGLRAEDVATCLSAFAIAEDGTVEGLVHDEKPVLAMQWHPERPGTDDIFGKVLVQEFLAKGRFW